MMIPLVKPYIPEREVLMPELEKILYSGYIAEGEAVYQFEAQFSKFIGNPFSLAVHAGTDALHLALLLAGVKPGDDSRTNEYGDCHDRSQGCLGGCESAEWFVGSFFGSFAY